MYHLIFVVKIKNNMKVCILGDGLSSLTLAGALLNQNIQVDIGIKNRLKINKSRTIGISKSNFEYINKYIVNINNISWKLKKIEIFSDNLVNEKLLNFESSQEYLFSIVRNEEFYKILEKKILKNKFFKRIKFNNPSVLKNYDLVINTDLSNLITKRYFNKKIIKKYNSIAHTTILKHESISNRSAIQIFTKSGPIAFLPISKNETSVVYSLNNLKFNKNIEDLIRKYNFKYKIEKIEKIEKFELKSLNLRSYYYKNILAFGDLLHRIHPLAGQGFNMTIRDIIFLSKIIKDKIDLGLSLDSSVNSEFEKSLRHRNFLFSNGIDLIHEFFNFERKLDNNFLSKSVKLLGKNYSINNMFKKIADKGIEF